MKKVCCMLSYAGLPKSFLVEAAFTACFPINRSSSTAIDKITPQEVWFGTPTSYSDLKIFGCPAYAHVDNGKLEPRSIKYVFLGYNYGVKGYRLWCPKTKKVIVSKDVIFHETVILHDSSFRDSCDKEQQKSSTRVEFEFKFGLGSIPKSTSQSSSEMKNGVVVPSPPPTPPQYSVAKVKPRRDINLPQ